MGTTTSDQDEQLRRSCTRGLLGHGVRTAADHLALLTDDVVEDRYGDGGVVDELEGEVADLLGTQGAMFLPSGTMAQQIALRIHADARGRRTILFHPTSHLHLHEGQAHERLHGLTGRPVGSPVELLTVDDLDGVGEPAAALLLELPQREIGGQLPPWDDLVAQTRWARERGAAVHLDGARLWQCGAAYGRPLAEIAALFDTTYVSFYKDLGGIAGSCLAGTDDVLAQAREWRHRHGGTLFGLWPYAASALACLRLRLPRMAAYRDHAVAIAAALATVDGLAVRPGPPHASMFHLLVRGTDDHVVAGMRTIARDEQVWIGKQTRPSDHPGFRTIELTVGDGTLEFTVDEVRDLLARLPADA